jgi:hypothetical protein
VEVAGESTKSRQTTNWQTERTIPSYGAASEPFHKAHAPMATASHVICLPPWLRPAACRLLASQGITAEAEKQATRPVRIIAT